mgnify:CR=1 FL=1
MRILVCGGSGFIGSHVADCLTNSGHDVIIFDFKKSFFLNKNQIFIKGKSLTSLQKRLGHQSMNYLALYTQMPEQEEKELLDGAEFK